MRILHIMTDPHLTNGAAIFEYRVSRFLAEDGIYFDYLCTEAPPEEDLERYAAVGSRVYVLPIDETHGLVNRELKINKAYLQFFKTHQYRVVYADTVNALRAIHLLQAKRAGIRYRIVHSHSSSLQTSSKSSIRIARILRNVFLFSATDYFACSKSAAEWLFPEKIYKQGRYKLARNGIDLSIFRYDEMARKHVRKQLHIPEGATVVGNVGRYVPQKNHSFLIQVFNVYHAENPNSKLLLIGDGPLKEQIEELCRRLAIRDHVIFLSNIPDVSDYMQAMDVYVMPSLVEGLPITGIEAQATGLPCIFSDTITKELAVTDHVRYMSLDVPAEKWCKAIKESAGETRTRTDDQIRACGYAIEDTAAWLRDYYLSLADE